MTVDEYKLDTETRDNDIRSLMEDHRYNAILALLSTMREEQIVYTSSPNLASEPYTTAHQLGCISALLSLENHLDHIWKLKSPDEQT